jgi:Bacterial protein of unknown function (DUF937)
MCKHKEDRIMNLVDLVKDQLGGNGLTRLAETLGTSPDNTRTAVNAAIPTLLTALGSVASTRDGARDLAAAVGSLDDRVLDNIPQSLSGGGRSGLNLGDIGTKLLGSLLGGNALSGLASALGRFTGQGSGAISSLLTMLAPIVLGVLKSRTGGMGSDANALTSLFAGQRQNIIGAMPRGLSDQLASVPGISAAAEWARSTAGAAYQTGRTAVSAAGSSAPYAAAGSSALRWALPVLAVLVVGALLWWWGSRSTPPQMTAPVPPPQTTAPVSPPTLGTDQVARLTGQVTDFFRAATDTFTGIKDTASAEAAAPRLRELSTRLDALRVGLNQLPTDARAKLVALVQDQGAKLLPTIEAAMATPVVGDTLKPFVDDLRSKLNALGTT